MNLSFYIARRYLFSKSSNNAINIISLIALFGIIISSAALFVVLSGFAGLKDFTLEFSSLADPDLKIVPATGKSFNLSDEQIDRIYAVEGVASYSKTIEERVVIAYENKSEIVTLKGVDAYYPQTTIDTILTQGVWFGYDGNEVVAGWGVSNSLSFGVLQFDKAVELYVPKPGKGQITSLGGAYNSIRAINTGVFQINEDLDNSYVFTSLRTARTLLGFQEGQISALEIHLDQSASPEVVKEALQEELGDAIAIKTRFQLNDALYKMLNTENLVVYLIFLLVLIIALFNVVGALIMMILDKQKNLKTLFNLGLNIQEIRRVFFYLGSLMVLLGGLVGLGLGFLLVVLQKQFGWVPITPSLPYPVSINVFNVLIVLATIIVLGVIVSKIVSTRISNRLVATT